jgi:hypothetical protein
MMKPKADSFWRLHGKPPSLKSDNQNLLKMEPTTNCSKFLFPGKYPFVGHGVVPIKQRKWQLEKGNLKTVCLWMQLALIK